MANQFGIDMGQVYKTTEAVKGSRQTRKANALAMDWKKEDRESARQRSQTINQLRAKVAAGGEEGKQAERQLIAFAPEEATKVQEAFANMDERQRKQASENVETLGRVSTFILEGQTVEEQSQRYQRARANLAPEIVANMPEEYDPNFVQIGLARARELDDLLENPEQITFGNEDRLYKDGRLIESTDSNALLKQQAGGSGSDFKSSDENLMFRQAAELLGGFFDQQGNLQNLDPEKRSRVQAITTRAAELFQSGETRTRSQAVTEAARQLGISVQNLGGGGIMDRSQLLEIYGTQ
jgi:hypothetical protein